LATGESEVVEAFIAVLLGLIKIAELVAGIPVKQFERKGAGRISTEEVGRSDGVDMVG